MHGKNGGPRPPFRCLSSSSIGYRSANPGHCQEDLHVPGVCLSGSTANHGPLAFQTPGPKALSQWNLPNEHFCLDRRAVYSGRFANERSRRGLPPARSAVHHACCAVFLRPSARPTCIPFDRTVIIPKPILLRPIGDPYGHRVGIGNNADGNGAFHGRRHPTWGPGPPERYG